jgi:hypothetical protein
MKKNPSHATKTLTDRHNYQKAITRTATEATLNEDLDFDTTTKKKENTSEEIQRERRSLPAKEIIKSVIAEYWIQGILTILAAAIIFLFIDSKNTLYSIEKDIEIQQQQLDQLSKTIDKNDTESKRHIQDIQNTLDAMRDKIDNVNEENNQRDILISEIKIRLDLLIQEIDKQN